MTRSEPAAPCGFPVWSAESFAAEVRPSIAPDWHSAREETLSRPCMCCGIPGHYQRSLEAHVEKIRSITPIVVESGVVQDGHHRALAAIRFGVEIPTWSGSDARQQWIKEHGEVPWEERRFGDLLPFEVARLTAVLDKGEQTDG